MLQVVMVVPKILYLADEGNKQSNATQPVIIKKNN